MTEVEKNTENKYYYDKRRDVVYSGFRVDIFKAFLSDIKVKKVTPEGAVHLKSFGDIRKYGDAIKWGSDTADEPLPYTYYQEMDRFKASFKKEHNVAKTSGLVKESEADAISSTLYEMMCSWAIEKNNIFVWVYTLLQWNLIAHSINVDPLGFHNFKREQIDLIKVIYYKSKTVQSGESFTTKNIFANPKNPTVCCFLGLTVWVCVSSAWLEGFKKLFSPHGTKDGAASNQYAAI